MVVHQLAPCSMITTLFYCYINLLPHEEESAEQLSCQIKALRETPSLKCYHAKSTSTF